MRTRQRGIALLTAIILVAIATIIATAVAWKSAVHARRAAGVLTVAQSLAYAKGAEAIAIEALNQNRQKFPKQIDPSQIWARPIGPVEIDTGVVFEEVMEDQAGKFNLNSLVTMSKNPVGLLLDNTTTLTQFEFLLQELKIDKKYAARLMDWIDTDNQPYAIDGAEDSYYLAQQPPYRTPNMTLTSVSELLAMGMDRVSYDKLKNLVTALPPDTKLNTCTAPGEVLDAIQGTTSFSLDSEALARDRAKPGCFPTPAVFESLAPSANRAAVHAQVNNSSNYFRLRTWITIGTTRFTLYSLIEQDNGGQLRPILRTFGTE